MPSPRLFGAPTKIEDHVRDSRGPPPAEAVGITDLRKVVVSAGFIGVCHCPRQQPTLLIWWRFASRKQASDISIHIFVPQETIFYFYRLFRVGFTVLQFSVSAAWTTTWLDGDRVEQHPWFQVLCSAVAALIQLTVAFSVTSAHLTPVPTSGRSDYEGKTTQIRGPVRLLHRKE
jgi:hypothetical protein